MIRFVGEDTLNMSWQADYERRYLQKLRKDWRPDGKKINHRRARRSVTFDDLNLGLIEESRMKIEECFNQPSPLCDLFKEDE